MKYTIYNILYRVFYTEEIIHVRNNIPRVYLFIVLAKMLWEAIQLGKQATGVYSSAHIHLYIYIKKISIF